MENIKNNIKNTTTANITTNGNVTVDVMNTSATPIDRTKEVLISNDTTFSELLSILTHNPEMLNAAKLETAEEERREKEEKLRKAYGEDYEYPEEMETTDDLSADTDIHGYKETDDSKVGTHFLVKAPRRPGAVYLRTYVPLLARLEHEQGGIIEVFNNGYCIYDNGNRKTVVWILDCGNYTYYFNPLRDNEREYLSQKDELGEDFLGSLPWYHAVMLRGEDQIWKNSEHLKSKRTMSDADEDIDVDVAADYYWCSGGHIETPEEYVMRIEMENERRAALTEKQREVYVLYYEQGMTEEMIASYLGISRSSVKNRLGYARKKFKENIDKFF